MLGLLYNLDPHEALKRCQQFHDTRRAPLGVPSPQTATQRAQVIRIVKKEMEKRKRMAAKSSNNKKKIKNATKMQKLQQEVVEYEKLRSKQIDEQNNRHKEYVLSKEKIEIAIKSLG